MSLSRRHLQFKIKLGQGTFASGDQETTIEGLRSSVEIERLGLGSAQADVRIYGMAQELMNRLTTNYQFYLEQRRPNLLTILAGDDDGGMAVCFSGTIYWSWCDARQQPDIAFWISAAPGQYSATQAVPPVSFKGTVDAVIVARGIAEQMHYTLAANGVDARINSPYLPGSPKSQIEALCRAVDCLYEIDETNQTIWMWPKGGQKSDVVADVSPDTGLIGYPAFTQSGIQFSTLYNPSIEIGKKVRMKSGLEPANGEWLALKVSHSLESDMPDGRWFTTVECIYPGADYGQ